VPDLGSPSVCSAGKGNEPLSPGVHLTVRQTVKQGGEGVEGRGLVDPHLPDCCLLGLQSLVLWLLRCGLGSNMADVVSDSEGKSSSGLGSGFLCRLVLSSMG
jgi:hypothetical protein